MDDGDGNNRAGKTAKTDDGIGLIAQLRSVRKPRRSLLRTSAMPKTAMTAPGSKQMVGGGVA